MKTKIKFLFFLIFISCASLKNDEKLKKDIVKCIALRSETYADNLFNIHNKYEELETFLLKKKILKSKSKEDYKKLLSELFASKKGGKKNIKLYREITTEVKYSHAFIEPGIFLGPIECVRFHIKKNELDKKGYSKYYFTLQNVINNLTFENQSAYFDLILNTPNNKFKSIVFRAPILSIYIGALEYSIRQ